MPERASPLLVEELLFLVNRNGIASCLDARTGKIFWQERIKGAYSASPIYSKGRIYLFNEDSVCTVIKPARKLEVLSVNPLSGEQLMATPAVDGDSFLLRTDKHLYRVTNAAPQ